MALLSGLDALSEKEQQDRMASYAANLIEQAEKQMEQVTKYLHEGEEVSIIFGNRLTLQNTMCPVIKSYTLVAINRVAPLKFANFPELYRWLLYRTATEEVVDMQMKEAAVDDYKKMKYGLMYGGGPAVVARADDYIFDVPEHHIPPPFVDEGPFDEPF